MDVRARVAVASHHPGDNLLQIVTAFPERLTTEFLQALAEEVRTGIGCPVVVTVIEAGVSIEQLVWLRCPALAGLPAAEVPRVLPQYEPLAAAGAVSAEQFEAREGAMELQHEYIRWRTRRGLQPSLGFEGLAARFDRAVRDGGFPAIR